MGGAGAGTREWGCTGRGELELSGAAAIGIRGLVLRPGPLTTASESEGQEEGKHAVLTAVAGKARGRVEVAGVIGELVVARAEEEGSARR